MRKSVLNLYRNLRRNCGEQTFRKLSNAGHVTSSNVNEVTSSNVNEVSYGTCLPDANSLQQIELNSKNRKQAVDLKGLEELINKHKASSTSSEKEEFQKKIQQEFSKLPNSTCPNSAHLKEPKLLRTFGQKVEMEDPLSLQKLSHHGVYMGSGHFTGSRSYYLRGSMAKLEHSLTRYASKILLDKGFRMMSVPDIVPRDVLERCGIPVGGRYNAMVYSLNDTGEGCFAEFKFNTFIFC